MSNEPEQHESQSPEEQPEAGRTTRIDIQDGSPEEAETAETEAVDDVEASAEATDVAEEAAAEPEPDPFAKMGEEIAALKDQLLRARAEFDNFRKRKAREMDQLRKTAASGLIRDLLPVVDNLERALEHAEDRSTGLAQGVEMVLKQLCDTLTQQGLEPIEAMGQPFDPNLHEAMTHQPSEEHDADMVMLEYERGYKLGDGVLRPAKVVVSSGPAAPAAPAEETETETDQA
jgi:molecular chaperone GrpE